jgi:hypothetical protein
MADIVRPQHDGEDASPETKVQKPNREEPRGTPEAASEGVLDYSYLWRFATLLIRAHIHLPASLSSGRSAVD